MGHVLLPGVIVGTFQLPGDIENPFSDQVGHVQLPRDIVTPISYQEL